MTSEASRDEIGGARTQVAATGPLNAHEMRLLAAAGKRSRSLRAAIRLAWLNGVGLLVAAALCLLGGLLDASLLIAAALLAALGGAELRGASLLRSYDPKGPRWLMWNQAALFVCVAAYCAYRLYAGLTGPTPFDELLASEPMIQELLGAHGGADLAETLTQAYRATIVAVYATVIGATALYQGICALFYRSRGAIIEEHLAQTPQWVREAQEALEC